MFFYSYVSVSNRSGGEGQVQDEAKRPIAGVAQW